MIKQKSKNLIRFVVVGQILILVIQFLFSVKKAQALNDVNLNLEVFIAECFDGIDNDDDLLIDYPDDPDCTSISDNTEALYVPPPEPEPEPEPEPQPEPEPPSQPPSNTSNDLTPSETPATVPLTTKRVTKKTSPTNPTEVDQQEGSQPNNLPKKFIDIKNEIEEELTDIAEKTSGSVELFILTFIIIITLIGRVIIKVIWEIILKRLIK